MAINISVAQYLPISKANGPGLRSVIWVYGCDQKCDGCCNPHFQSFRKPETNIKELANQIIEDAKKNDIRGITFSGGEPLHQVHTRPIQELIELIIAKQNHLDIMAFTGYDNIPEWVKEYFDLLIAGPYIETMKWDRGVIASTNQKIIRYNKKFNDVNDNDLVNNQRIIEMYINNNGGITISGLANINIDNEI